MTKDEQTFNNLIFLYRRIADDIKQVNEEQTMAAIAFCVVLALIGVMAFNMVFTQWIAAVGIAIVGFIFGAKGMKFYLLKKYLQILQTGNNDDTETGAGIRPAGL